MVATDEEDGSAPALSIRHQDVSSVQDLIDVLNGQPMASDLLLILVIPKEALNTGVDPFLRHSLHSVV
jgi:hypothetical protein